MEITLEMYQAAKQLLTCATAWKCPKESPCFSVAHPIVVEYEAQAQRNALDRVEAQNEVDYYAPHFPPSVVWEWANSHVDWDAA